MSSVEPQTEILTPNAKSRLFGRGLLYVVVWSLQLVAGTIISPVLAYLMGPTEFGALASSLALFQVLSVVVLLGLDQALMLQRAEDSTGHASRGLVAVGIAVAVVITFVFAVTSPLWRDLLGFTGNHELVFAAIVWSMPAAGVQLTLALLLAEDRFKPFVAVSVVAAVGGQITGVLLLVLVHNDPALYVWGCAGSQTLAMLIGIIAAKPDLRGLINWPVAWRAIRLGVPLALGGLAYFVLNAGDRIVIQRMLGTEEVGRYQVAYVVGSAVILLLTFTSTAWTPRFAAVHDHEERWLLAFQSRDELYRILLPILLGLTLAAPVLLRIVAPPSFRPETLTLVVFLVALAAFPFAASVATGRLLITLRKAKTIGAITGVVAIVNILLNILLVPVLGITGAALATVVAYGLLAILQRAVIPRTPVWQGPSGRLVLAVTTVILAAAGTVFLPQTLGWNVARFAVGLLCLPWAYRQLKKARSTPPIVTPPDTDDMHSNMSSEHTTPRQLRILADAKYLTPYGGIELSTLEDSAVLVARGHKVFLLYEIDGPQRPEYEAGGIVIAGQVVFGLVKRHFIRNFWRDARAARRVRPDVLWMNRSENIIWAQVVARWARIPIVCHLHQVPNFRYTRLLYSGVTRFVAVSDFIRDAWVARGIAASRITVIHNAISLGQYPFGELEERTVARRRLDIPQETAVVLYYGRVSTAKGVLTLVDAWEKLHLTEGTGLLLLLGWIPPEDDEIGRALDRLPAWSYRWVPGQADVVPFLHAADVVVVPSMVEEAFGRVVIEAMSTGRPVIASEIGGIPEILEGEMSRFLVPPGDAVALSERLATVLSWRTDEPELARTTHAIVAERFPHSVHIARVEQVLCSVARGH